MNDVNFLSDRLPLVIIVAGGLATTVLVRTTRLGYRPFFYFPILGAVIGVVAGTLAARAEPDAMLGGLFPLVVWTLRGTIVGGCVMVCGLVCLTLFDLATFLAKLGRSEGKLNSRSALVHVPVIGALTAVVVYSLAWSLRLENLYGIWDAALRGMLWGVGILACALIAVTAWQFVSSIARRRELARQ
jgi:hypothetical protein